MTCKIEQMMKNLESLYTEVKGPLITQVVPPIVDKLRVVKARGQIEINNKFQEYYDNVLVPFNRNAAAQEIKQVNVVSSVNNGYQDLSNYNAADVDYKGEKFVSIEVAYQLSKARQVVKDNPTEVNKDTLKILETLRYPGEIMSPTDTHVAMVDIDEKTAELINKMLLHSHSEEEFEPIKAGKKHVASISKLARNVAKSLKFADSSNENDSIDLLSDIINNYYAGENYTESSLWNRDLLLDTAVGNNLGGFSHNDLSIKDHWAMTFPILLYKAREKLIDKGASTTSGEKAATVKEGRKNLVVEKAVRATPVFDSLPSYVEGQKTMTYAGIGSRETPESILKRMTQISKHLSGMGYTLNTGYKRRTYRGIEEEGADKAFSIGTDNKNLFGPDMANEKTMAIAKEIHKDLDGMAEGVYTKMIKKGVSNDKAREYAEGAKQLQARNTFQVFGKNLDSPVDFVLFYAKETKGIRPEGGTGQAVEMARKKGIPTINMATEGWENKLREVLNMEQRPTSISTNDELEVKDCK